jgi:hypothetical protein
VYRYQEVQVLGMAWALVLVMVLVLAQDLA